MVLMRSRALVGEVDVESAPFIHPTQGYLNTKPSVARPEDVERAASLLAEAKFPVIVAGNGVHMANGHSQLQRLAEMLGAGVATSYKGKSTLPETHPQALGMVGQYGQQAANTAVGRADVVLVVGAKLSSQETVGETPSLFNPKRQTIIQIDVEERNAGWSFPIDIGLIGDAKEVMAQLIAALDGSDRDTSQRVKGLAALKKQASYYNDPELFMDSSPVMPQRLIRLLQETLDPSTIISPGRGQQQGLDVPPLPVSGSQDHLRPRRYGGDGLEPACGPCAQARPPRPARSWGHGGWGLHDVRPRTFDRRPVQSSRGLRGAERLIARHGATPPGRKEHLLGVCKNRSRGHMPLDGRLRRPDQRFQGKCRTR